MEEAGDLMSEQSTHIQFQNTNKWETKQLVTMALMCAIGAIFMYVQIPILPSAPFLSYDPSLVPAMVCGFAYGPVSGLTVGVLAVVIHALTTGDWVGGLMNIVAAIFFILPAALAYKKLHSFRGQPHHRRVVLVSLDGLHHAAHRPGDHPLQPHQDRTQFRADACRVQGDLEPYHARKAAG